MTPKTGAVIVGTGMTAFGKHYDRSLQSIASEAVIEAMTDAGVTAEDIGIVFFGNGAAGVLHGQEMIRAQSSLKPTGLLGTPMVNVENACASASTAFAMAVMAVQSGTVDVALAVGAEKLTHAEKARSLTAIATAVDLEWDPASRRLLSESLLGWDMDEQQRTTACPSMGSRFMDIYAELATKYMTDTGATAADFAAVASKNFGNGALNPKAQYQRAISAEEVLASRQISGPIHLLMCSPIGDGAAALVVTSSDYAARSNGPAIGIEAVSLVSGREREPGEPGAIERALKKAFDASGVGPQDLDVVEVHDAASPGELFAYEDIGLCARGDAPKLLASGETTIGGRVPVNPSGGLLAKGHPIGATGCAQIVELADQLRGRAGARQAINQPKRALAHNAGGTLGIDEASAVVTVLSAPNT
jgi:acetyl-CoA acetyltransferase